MAIVACKMDETYLDISLLKSSGYLTYHQFLGRFSPFLWATKAFRMSRGIALLFLGPRHQMEVGGVSPTTRPPLPAGKTRYPLYRRLGGSQGRSGQAENLVNMGIRSRTVRHVAQSLYRLSYPTHATSFDIHKLYMVLTVLLIVLYGLYGPNKTYTRLVS